MSAAAQTRRDALSRASLAAGALAAAGAVRPALALAQASNDDDLRDFLVHAIGLEQIAALAYSTAADANGVEAKLSTTLDRFRDQEQAHATALRSAIDELGSDPPDAPNSPSDTAVFDGVDGLDDATASDLKDLLSGLDGLKSTDEYLDYLEKLEREQLDLYLGAAQGLDSEDLSTSGAEIAGCEAEHLVVLRGELGDKPAEALDAATRAATSAVASAESSTSSSGTTSTTSTTSSSTTTSQ